LYRAAPLDPTAHKPCGGAPVLSRYEHRVDGSL